jgi:hypothetical protein
LSRLHDEHARFVRLVDRYSGCCARMEEMVVRNAIRLTDAELLYGSTFLSVCSRWESLLILSLAECVCGSATRAQQRRRLVTVSTREALHNLLLYPGRNYVSLPAYKEALKLGGLFLQDGRPFSAVSESSRTYLEQAAVIRNAIAHESDHAISRFRRSVPGIESLPLNRRRPASYLRHQFRRSPDQRRYELYFAAFKTASAEIVAGWG